MVVIKQAPFVRGLSTGKIAIQWISVDKPNHANEYMKDHTFELRRKIMIIAFVHTTYAVVKLKPEKNCTSPVSQKP